MGKQRRNLFTILLFVCIAMMFGPKANASSAALLEATAEGKIKSLMGCIKSNNNDISMCLDKFTEYLRTEIQLVNAAPDEPKYKSRLNKMVEYLRKSADIFYQKAQSYTRPRFLQQQEYSFLRPI